MANKVTRITDKRLNFCNIYTVQIKTEVYGFKHNTDPSRFTKFSELYSNDIKTTALDNSPTARGYPGLISFKDSFIFVSGGNDPVSYAEQASVDCYDIARSNWIQAPDMNTARRSHSGCSLGDSVYNFCGYNKASEWLNSIERLNANYYVCGGRNSTWITITIVSGMMNARSNPLVAAFSPNEIIILGGSFNRYLSDGYIFNTDFNTIQKVLDMPDDNKFETGSNQCAMVDEGKVAGIIVNQ